MHPALWVVPILIDDTIYPMCKVLIVLPQGDQAATGGLLSIHWHVQIVYKLFC